MKKVFIVLISVLIFIVSSSCASQSQIPSESHSAQDVIDFMIEQNEVFVSASVNSGDISEEKRVDTAENGQKPYAVVVTCSDSRVPPEHIFDAGIGELFVIRTAGNVIGDYELGSVEYGAEHLNAKLVIVLGHTNCGAVDAALNGGAHGYIEKITDEISACLTEGCDARTAEKLNVENSIEKIKTSGIMQKLEESGKVQIKGAIYDIATGKVMFID